MADSDAMKRPSVLMQASLQLAFGSDIHTIEPPSFPWPLWVQGHLGQGQGGIQERTYTPNRSQVPSMLSLSERQVLNATRTSWPCPILSITDDNLRGYAQRLAQLRLTNGFLWLRYLIKLVAQLRYGLWRIRSPQPATAAGEDKCDLHIREPAGLEEMEVFSDRAGACTMTFEGDCPTTRATSPMPLPIAPSPALSASTLSST
jgi:hypothetical protein